MGGLKALVYENGGSVEKCLQALAAGAGHRQPAIHVGLRGQAQDSLRDGYRAWQLEWGTCAWTLHENEPAFEDLANRLFLADPESRDYLLFLSSSVELDALALERLVKSLEAEPDCAGLNPCMLAGWAESARIAHLGTVCDCQKRIHYLYEGIAATSPLVQKRRYFQFGHPGCLLVRQRDFCRTGGFNTKIGPLAFYAFCLELQKLAPRGFSTLPEARAVLHGRFDSWEFCGIWNSILQRGRLNTAELETDYIFRAMEDDLEYKLDPWLNEFALLPEDEPGGADGAWLKWRRQPSPAALLAYIGSLPDENQRRAIELCRNLGASLPRLFAWYPVQCAKVAEFAKERGLEGLQAQAGAWSRKSLRFHHGLLKPGMELLRKAGIYDCALDESPATFDGWVELAEKFPKLEVGATWPQIAVVMPVWNPEPEFLRQALDSVLAQTYPNWQLCLADDASTRPEIPEMLRAWAGRDGRISLKTREQNGHISRATNSALEMVNAPWTAFMDQDDTLAREALGLVARAAVECPQAAFIYTDEDKIDRDNVRRNPVFKAGFDNDLFCTAHLSAFLTQLVRDAGGLRPGLEGSQDFDFVLRITEKLQDRQILHIPHILYHWRVHENSTAGTVASKPYVLEATKRAMLEAATRRGEECKILPAAKTNAFLFSFAIPKCSCSVILLAERHAPQPDQELAAWLRRLSELVKLEIMVQPLQEGLAPAKLGDLGVNVLPFAGASWLSACAAAARHARGEILLFLYAGLRPLPGSMPEQLLACAARRDIAMAGGMIWQGGRLAHGGLYPDISGLPFPLLRGITAGLVKSYVWGEFMFPRHVLGVCWQCMAVRRELCAENFLDGRFGELALADYSLRHGEQDRHTMITPWAQWESPWLELGPEPAEKERFAERWGEGIKRSGLRNANLRRAPDDDWMLIFE